MTKKTIPLPKIELGQFESPVWNYTVGRTFGLVGQGDVAEIVLYETIGQNMYGEGVSAANFRAALDKVEADRIVLKINSPGGDVFDGIAMYNDLIAHKAHVRVEIMGLAASAASLIAMAGDEVAIAPNAHLMIHNAWVMAMGDRNAFEATARVLRGIDNGLAETYAARSGLNITEIAAMMDAETWLRGSEAVAKGFADEVLEGGKAPKAAYDLRMFAHAPPDLKRDVESALRDAGASAREAKAALSQGLKRHGARDVAVAQEPPLARDATESGWGDVLQAVRSVSAHFTS